MPTLCRAAISDKSHYGGNPSALLLDSARESSSVRRDPGDDSSDPLTSGIGDSIQRFVDKFLAAGGGTAPVGTRGEVYVFAQAALVVAIVLGGLPGVSPVLGFLAGPGLVALWSGGTRHYGTQPRPIHYTLAHTQWSRTRSRWTVWTGVTSHVFRSPSYDDWFFRDHPVHSSASTDGTFVLGHGRQVRF